MYIHDDQSDPQLSHGVACTRLFMISKALNQFKGIIMKPCSHLQNTRLIGQPCRYYTALCGYIFALLWVFKRMLRIINCFLLVQRMWLIIHWNRKLIWEVSHIIGWHLLDILEHTGGGDPLQLGCTSIVYDYSGIATRIHACRNMTLHVRLHIMHHLMQLHLRDAWYCAVC